MKILITKNIIFHCTSNIEKLSVKKAFKRSKIVVIPNGITTKINKSLLCKKRRFLKKYREYDFNNQPINLLYIGRIDRKKQIEIIIEVLSKLKDNFSLNIAGSGDNEYLQFLHEKIERYSLSKQVFFLGFVDGAEKEELITESDILLFPSINENFGNVVLESLSLGTPVIASNGTPWDNLNKYNCGYCVDADVDVFLEKITDLLSLDRYTVFNNCLELSKKYNWSEIANNFFKEMNNG